MVSKYLIYIYFTLGCKVHYMRNVKKCADKVCGNDKESNMVFVKIAHAIPNLESQEDVHLAFAILTGETSINDENAEEFLTSEKVALTETELDVDTSRWSSASNWAKWWSKPKILTMFTQSYREMTDADWSRCPTTTNAVESHNKVGNIKSTRFKAVLENFYRTDKNAAYKAVAAEHGIGIGPSQEERREKNETRRSKRNKT